MSSDYTLAYGTHATPDEGRCAMEWVSYIAGEPHSDEPACVSPAVRAFCTTFNDSLPDARRQRLRPYLARTIGTASDGLDEMRAWMAMDWLIREYTPRWLAAAGHHGPAQQLRTLEPVLTVQALEAALEPLAGARSVARAVWRDALGARRAAVWAPWLAGRMTAREQAWESAAAAAWSAARLGIGDVAGDRARAAVREIAGDAAATVGRDARVAGMGRAAARDAARASLAPIVAELQRSAFGLLDRMLPTVELDAPVDDGRCRSGRCAAPGSGARLESLGTFPLTSGGHVSSLLDYTVQGDVGTISDESKLPQVTLMTPLQLYRLWERQNWSSHEIDLAQDRRDWEALSDELRDEMTWGLSAFFVGEERVTNQFSGLVMAAEDKHEEAFLLTQQVDEARHAQHFNRLYEEVAELRRHASRIVSSVRGAISPPTTSRCSTGTSSTPTRRFSPTRRASRPRSTSSRSTTW